MATADLTAQRLREMFHYDPESGVFTRLYDVRTGCGGRRVIARAGDQVGTDCGNGYLRVVIDGKVRYLHRLAWLYVTGRWPKGKIDHIDGRRKNNRFPNLRDASDSVNAQNVRAAKASSKVAMLGVSQNRKGWTARITVDYKMHRLGTYKTPEEAHAVYLEAKRRLHAGCTL